jgi:hypothetical protein
MKYLKLFEESKMSRTNELKQFCSDNLAYLIDNNNFKFSIKISNCVRLTSNSTFRTSISYPYDKKIDTIIIEKFRRNNFEKSEIFEFNDFSDDLVPFILFLNEKYSLSTIYYQNEKNNVKYHSVLSKSNLETDISFLDNSKIKMLIITINK